MRKKEHLARILAATGLYSLSSFLRSRFINELPILAYHRIYDLEDATIFPFDSELISASRTSFEWQMRYIKAHYNPISFQTLLDVLDGKALLPGRPLIVTFDDGYEDNYYNAFPILKSLDIPATIFISTGYIGNKKPFWFDLMAHILNHVPTGCMMLKDLQLTLRLDDNVASRHAATTQLFRALRSVSNEQRLGFLDWFEYEYAFAIHKDSFQLNLPMNWDQVREMHDAGIEFGSHTITHPILSQLDDEALKNELIGSRQKLDQELGESIPVLAYPVGDKAAFNERVIDISRSIGYRLGVSYIEGINCLDRMDHFSLRRQHVERYTSKYFFIGLLTLPEIFW